MRLLEENIALDAWKSRNFDFISKIYHIKSFKKYNWNQIKLRLLLSYTEAEREGKRCLRYAWSEGYSSIDSANERASSAAKSTRLITAFSFLSPARHLPSGCSQASCTGGQELRLAGYSLRPLPTRFFSSGPKLPFFA